MAEHLLVMCEGPGSIPNTTNRKRKRTCHLSQKISLCLLQPHPMGVSCLGDSGQDLSDNRKLPLLTSAETT